MSLSFLALMSMAVGVLLAAAGGAWWWLRPRTRGVAWVFWGLAALVQSWWVAALVLVFVKFVVLGEDT